MTETVPGYPKAIRALSEHSHRIAHGRGDLSDRSDLVLHALLSNSDTVTRTSTTSRNRINLGRPSARYHSDGVLITVGQPALQGWLDDGLPRSAARTPEWDTRTGDGDDPCKYTDVRIDSPAHRDGQGWVVIPSEDLVFDDVERDDAPVWSTEERICADWTRILRDALDPEDSTVIEHSTTLATLACIRMIRASAIGHVQYSPALGRDGRVTLPDIYDDVDVVSLYVPEDRLLFDVDTARRIAEQKGEFNPHNEFNDLPEFSPPSNGFLEAD